jgi:hypothetical protein
LIPAGYRDYTVALTAQTNRQGSADSPSADKA